MAFEKLLGASVTPVMLNEMICMAALYGLPLLCSDLHQAQDHSQGYIRFNMDCLLSLKRRSKGSFPALH